MVSKNTPLHIAAKYGYLNIIEYLVQHGANVNQLENTQKTPLEIARMSEYTDIVEFLEQYVSSRF